MSSFTEGLFSKLKYKYQEKTIEILPERDSVLQHPGGFIIEIPGFFFTCDQFMNLMLVFATITLVFPSLF